MVVAAAMTEIWAVGCAGGGLGGGASWTWAGAGEVGFSGPRPLSWAGTVDRRIGASGAVGSGWEAWAARGARAAGGCGGMSAEI